MFVELFRVLGYAVRENKCLSVCVSRTEIRGFSRQTRDSLSTCVFVLCVYAEEGF